MVSADLLACGGSEADYVSSLDRLARRVEKYRPVTMDDLVSHEDITATCECLLLEVHAARRLH